MISVTSRHQAIRRLRRPRRRLARGARRLADRAARPERLGQVDAAADHRRASRRPTPARVEIDGEDATRVPPQQRGVGFVFQHYAAFKHMTVRDNVAFGLKIRKRPKAEIRARVDELLELVELDRLARALPVAALRRPAPADGAGPRARRRAEGAAARRAVRRARRQGPRRSCASGCAGCTTRST